ncbi:MAG: hypothetical protein II683_08610 [Muribaculaceae bacterium]|nr:hypothetical protein [Muribaculaceae bacterium]
MKKFYMILAAVAAFTLTAQAQTSGIINVGDISSANPYNGSYFDMAPTNFYLAHTGAQMLFTPDLLADLDGKQNVKIKSLKFTFMNESFETIERNVLIYLQESDATEFAVENNIKQFFPLETLVGEDALSIDLVDAYGDDCVLEYNVDFAFTPGKTLIVTMVYDAEDDDNCTMGSDYAPFYTSGIRGKCMTYTNNTVSFTDYALGNDFPDATAMLGCGTNVELPVTEIGYTYEEQTVTGIDDLTVKPATADDAYYNLQGQRMNSANLPAGIYIHQGKKVIVK